MNVRALTIAALATGSVLAAPAIAYADPPAWLDEVGTYSTVWADDPVVVVDPVACEAWSVSYVWVRDVVFDDAGDPVSAGTWNRDAAQDIREDLGPAGLDACPDWHIDEETGEEYYVPPTPVPTPEPTSGPTEIQVDVPPVDSGPAGKLGINVSRPLRSVASLHS